MEELSGFLYFFIAVLLIILIICYAALAIFLNNFNKKVYGAPSIMAWIPFANIFLLGKLTFNRDAGYGLVALFVLSCTLTMQIDRMTIVFSLPSVLQMILGAVFAGAFVTTLIFGIRKYGRLKNNNSGTPNKDTKNTKEVEEIAKANDDFFNN